ncbi:MAG TPA: 4Fe-4S ferredoxin, partial [Thermoplasmata archaeon]
CIGECPEDALRIIEREAPEFDEEAVEEHLKEAESHAEKAPVGLEPCGCPSHNPMLVKASAGHKKEAKHHAKGHEKLPPELTNWPIQWRLVSPAHPFFKNADVLIAADCAPFALRDFHGEFMVDRPVIIGCPKLDDQMGYLNKLTEVIRDGTPKSLTVVHMEVPCCHGLVKLVNEAVKRSGKKIPLKTIEVGIKGEILGTCEA